MISIAMSYFNRASQLRYTLNTISTSAVKDVEIVVADDFSERPQELVGLVKEFPNLNIVLIDMRDRFATKWWRNPCVPYNHALRACQGDKIILQNPECCHMGDVLDHVNAHLVPGRYLSFHAWAANKEDTRYIQLNGHASQEPLGKKQSRWYNHVQHKPTAFHFCNAISRADLIKINGFDERFAHGHSYDDVEILHRIRQICEVVFVADPWVVHQHHPKFFAHPDNPTYTQNNRELYETQTIGGSVRAPNLESII